MSMSIMDALMPANQSGFLSSDLNIKYLQDFWGSLLDMTTTVGQTFIDRACGVDISNSIVKVVRFPPTPIELENPFRCASVAPDSSARPRKRGFEEFAERDPTEVRDVAYGNTFVPEQLTSSQRVSKRQRRRNLDINDVGNYLRPIQSSELCEDVASQDSSRTPIVQRTSSIQVNDSQTSPGLKRMTSSVSLASNQLTHVGHNPYGTPLSFPLQSPQGLASFNHRGNVAIPESSPSEKTSLAENPSLLTTEREIGNAKSASPELDSSIHGISNVGNFSKSLEKEDIDDEGFGTRNQSASAVPTSSYLNSDLVHKKVTDSKLQESFHGQAVITGMGSSSSKPRFRLPGRVESNDISATSAKVRDIFDPIDTEGEKVQEPQNLRRVKRLKSNVSLPNKLPGIHQVPHEDIHPEIPTFPHTLQAQIKLPVTSELLGVGEQNRPSSSANTLEQALSPAKAVQETSNGSVERTPAQSRPHNLPLESQNQVGEANENARLIDERIKSALTNSLKRGVQRVHSVEYTPSQPQTERNETKNSDDIAEVSINSSLGRNTKEMQPDEAVAVTELVDSKSPDDSLRGKMSKPTNLEEEKAVAKSADRNSEEPKLADRVRRENARRDKVLQQFRGEVGESKPLREEEKPLKATDRKTGKSKARGENHKNLNSFNTRMMDERGEPETIKAVEPKKVRRDKVAKATELQHSVEGCSKSIPSREVSKTLEPPKGVTPKARIHPDLQTHGSVTSNPRNDVGRARKSMTPAFPGPALSKQISAESRPSIHTPSNQDSLSQSSTKRTTSTLSRKIAFSKDSSTLSSSQVPPEILAETDRSNKASGIVNERPRDISKIKKEPKSESLTDTLRNATNKTKQGKTQTKLKILRDVKGKGRVDDPPIRSKVELQEPIVLSSGNEESASSSCSEDETHLERVKAGPSRKRKKSPRADSSNDKVFVEEVFTADLGAPVGKLAITIEKQASLVQDQECNRQKKSSEGSKVKIAPESSTAINPKPKERQTKTSRENPVQGGAEPSLQAIKQENVTGELALPPSSIVGPNIGKIISSSPNSSPRAPAQYMSKPVSISSGSNSNADSEADYESNSEPESEPESESESESNSELESETNADARKLSPAHPKSDERNGTASQQKSTRNTPMELTAQENNTAQSKGDSSSFTPSKAKSSSQANSGASKISNKNPGREADEQLQRECRQSVRPNLPRASPTSSQPISDEGESKLSHPPNTNGESVESRSRPSNYPYPSMTEMKEKQSEKLRSQHLNNGSVLKPTLRNLDPKLLGNVSGTSSDSDDDDSDGEQDNGESEPKPSKTMHRLLKGRFTNESVPIAFAENFIVAGKAKAFAGKQRLGQNNV